MIRYLMVMGQRPRWFPRGGGGMLSPGPKSSSDRLPETSTNNLTEFLPDHRQPPA
ncbi:MAG: hypothetical protein JJU36_02825 [Phycisphaeraceae bacterium]|nr:hypothetical protein [Phycisphaeraceae bacterium]